MERLAADGVRFATAYAESSTTGPSHAVVLTGRHFRTLGVMKNGQDLPETAETLAEVLAADGYATAAFVSSYPLRSKFGFSQGFEFYFDKFDRSEASLGRRGNDQPARDRIAQATVDRVATWLRKRRDRRPLFAWVHLVDPHYPYRAPEEFSATWPLDATRQVRAYDTEIRYVDRQFGRLRQVFSELTAPSEDVVVLTSDHGEGLGDRDWMLHCIHLHDELVRVPLLMAWPGKLPAGQVVEEPSGIIDVTPTLLTLLGIDPPAPMHGRDLFGESDPDRRIFLQREAYSSNRPDDARTRGEMTAVVGGGMKFVYAPDEARRELFHLPSDPEEANNLLASGGTDVAAKARALEIDLASWRNAHPAAGDADKPIDDESREALRSLGYLD
jgi:arylsulfatase A-like enzyme